MKQGQLNTISAYDFKGSIINIDTYVSHAKAKGYTHVGIKGSDMFYFPKLASRCSEEKVTPVFLISVVIETTEGLLSGALVILNSEGYKNICYLKNNLDSNHLTIEDLKKVKKSLALIIETNNNFEFRLFQDKMAKELSKLKKIFEEHFYLGLGLYTKADYENASEIFEFASTCSYEIVPFHEVKYLEKKDAYYYEIFRASLENREAEKVEEGPNFLLSIASLEKIYSKNLLLSLDKLLNKISFDFNEKLGSIIFFDNDDNVLKEKAYQGMKRLNKNTKEYQERLDYELSVISEMKFSSYFLLVEDYVSFAKSQNIKTGPSRGSAGGSLVCYFLGITELDPIQYNLSFERFLNPKRVTMPDIDIDFDSERRDEIISYLYKKYNSKPNQVCNIIVFSTLKPRSALKFISSSLGYSENTLSPLLSTISLTSSDFGKAEKDLYLGESFKEILKKKSYSDLVDVARKIIGLPINTSIHASGVIVSSNSISDCCQIVKKENGTILCGYEYGAMEKLGFLKLDILALSNLTFIKHIENEILKRKKELPDIYSDLENKRVFSVLCKKLLNNIFQLDNSITTLKDIDLIQPDSFKDLCELIDLIRPGAKDYVDVFARRKQGKEKITYLDKSLEPILKETYGIMLYQEQIMEVVKLIAGFSLSEADLLRRAISKKKEAEIAKYYSNFVYGAEKRGIKKEIADKIYKDIEKFSNYGFNKAHSYGYGLITYTLLYYKTFFTEEFYTVSIYEARVGSKEFVQISKELATFGYCFTNPDINLSNSDTVVFKDKKVYLPLKIKSMSNLFLESIIKEREKGKYTSYLNFLIRNKDSFNNEENKRGLNSLIDGGAFDSLNKERDEIKDKTSLYLDAIKFYSDENEIENFLNVEENKKQKNIFELLVRERNVLGVIASVNIQDLVEVEKGYFPYIVVDNKNYENNKTIEVVSNNEEYTIKIDKKPKVDNYTCVMIKGSFNNKYRIKLIDDLKEAKLKEKANE